MTRSRILKAGAGLLVLAVLGFGAWTIWHRHVLDSRDRQNLAAARRAASERKLPETLALAALHERSGRAGDSEAEWRRLEADALARLGLPARLAGLYEEDFEAVAASEDASLLMLRVLQERRRESDIKRLRARWQGRETQAGAWLAVDADLLLRQGRSSEALALLKSRKLEGPADSGRLLRLAVLSAGRADEAWKYIEEALQADPRNPDVRLFRAQIFEARKMITQARVEYAAACVLQPENPLLLDRLAEFYRRVGNLPLAVDAWRTALRKAPLDFIRLKAWFWSRTARPLPDDWADLPNPPGSLKALNDALGGLPAGVLWDDRILAAAGGSGYALSRQEVFWLRLLQALKAGRESEASSLLRSNPFRTRSWAPNAEAALQFILERRLPAVTRIKVPIPEIKGEGLHVFFEALKTAQAKPGSVPPEWGTLMDAGREAFAAVFLAEGWLEAALFLHDPKVLPAGLPEWFGYGLAEALHENRGPRPALEFASALPDTPLISVLIGELRLALNDREAARAALRPWAGRPTPEGLRAAVLLAIDGIDSRRGEGVPAWVEGNTLLRGTVQGRELLARAALAAGRKDEARALFRALGETSPVALDFLAQEAFTGGAWEEAARMTRLLAGLYPDEPRYLVNLRVIEARLKNPAGQVRH